MNTTEYKAGYTVAALADVSKKECATGMRLARIIRKASAKDSNGMESQGVQVPVITCADDYYADTVVGEYLRNCLHDVQDKMIRAITDSGRGIITDSDLDVVAMRAYLEATDDNVGRLSKDKIVGWFDTELQDSLVLAFSEKLGVGSEPTQDQLTKLEQVTKQYRDCFAQLAGKQPNVAPKVGENLLKALDMIPATAFSERLVEITRKAMVQVEPDMLGL